MELEEVGLDHSVAVADGGSSELENLNFQICKTCNSAKGEFHSLVFKELVEVARKWGVLPELQKRLKAANLVFRGWRR